MKKVVIFIMAFCVIIAALVFFRGRIVVSEKGTTTAQTSSETTTTTTTATTTETTTQTTTETTTLTTTESTTKKSGRTLHDIEKAFGKALRGKGTDDLEKCFLKSADGLYEYLDGQNADFGMLDTSFEYSKSTVDEGIDNVFSGYKMSSLPKNIHFYWKGEEDFEVGNPVSSAELNGEYYDSMALTPKEKKKALKKLNKYIARYTGSKDEIKVINFAWMNGASDLFSDTKNEYGLYNDYITIQAIAIQTNKNWYLLAFE